MDQCKHCVCRAAEDIEYCESVKCSYHELWYTQQLKLERDKLLRKLNHIQNQEGFDNDKS